MPTWSGWQLQFLNAAGLPIYTSNRAFLSDWAKRSNTSCGNNPIDVSHAVSGSSNCAALQGTSLHAQKYPNHAAAATAFADQINSGKYPALKDAIRTGLPYSYSGWQAVEQDLVHWGSGIFEVYYGEIAAPNAGQGSGGGAIHAPHALKGWKAIQHSVNTNMRSALNDSEHMRLRALQSLSRARKVKL